MENNSRIYYELCNSLEKFLVSEGYSCNTIKAHKKWWRRLGAFLKEKGKVSYNALDGLEFLHREIDYPEILKTSPLSRENRTLIRAVRLLNEYNDFQRIPSKLKSGISDWDDDIKHVYDGYHNYCENTFRAKSTVKIRLTAVNHFINNAITNESIRFSDLTEKDISKYISCMKGMTKVSVDNYLRSLKVFLKYLYDNGYHERDLSSVVPKIRNANSERIPHWLSADDVSKLLNSIDRGNPLGKRDYAVITMAATLGMRDSDIVDLTFQNLDWERNTISFHQRKTGKNVVLPLLSVVGEAIIDYLRNGRPVTNVPYVFVKHKAPFMQMTSFYTMMSTRMESAGINTDPKHSRGLHVLRHTLATDLVKQGESYNTIASILGHSNIGSTQSYAHIDLDGLMKCALDMKEVLNIE